MNVEYIIKALFAIILIALNSKILDMTEEKYYKNKRVYNLNNKIENYHSIKKEIFNFKNSEYINKK
jgi:hypothetical protein